MNFHWNWDITIFFAFLLVNLTVGLYHGRKVKTIEDYALGGRNFTTGALVSTIIATWIGGDYLFITLAEVYKTGLHYAIGCLGMVVCLLLNAYVFVPKMQEFLGSISVAESMGKLYGKEIRIISAVCGTIASAGFIAVQFKVFGEILKHYVGLSGDYPIFIAASIVVIYSAFGGIRSVTFTDVIQFFTFGVLIPVLGFVVWNESAANISFSTKSVHHLFNYQEFLGLGNPKFWSLVLLFLLFSLPDINPTMFQRVAMGRDIPQVKKAFTIASFILLFILLGMAWIAFLLHSTNPDLAPKSLVQYLIDHYSPHVGLRSFILIGVVAMCMSTADSNINSSSVLLTHDFCRPLGVKFRNELALSKLISVLLGISSIYLALLDYDLLPLVFMTQSFYIPIIDVPLILAILGFRSTTKAVLIGMVAGFIGVIIWRTFFMDITNVDSILPGMVSNFMFFIGSHYLLKQEGGWIKTSTSNRYSSNHRQVFSAIREFNFLKFCKNNAPKNEWTYTGFGIFCIISTLCTMYSMSGNFDRYLLVNIYETMLAVSICFATYPIWPISLKKETAIQVIWNVTLLVFLVIGSTFFVMLSNFAHLQFTIFILNIIVLAILTRWNITFIFIGLGICLAILVYKYFVRNDLNIVIGDTQFIIYSLLLISTAIIIFFKPKEEYQALTEEKNEHLSGRIGSQEKQLREALALRSEFIRNINHEYHAPMTGITSVAETLEQSYDKLTEEQRRECVKIIVNSSRRLDFFASNLSSLSALSKAGYKLSLEKMNFSNLMHERIAICRKLYEEKKETRDFNINVEEGITIDGDKKYLIQLLDNLIINAITYCQVGKITIDLKQSNGQINFSVVDKGIGIPPDELENIFDEFTVSSRTRSLAGNRGIGLALCKRVVEVHGGIITAESDGIKGADFMVKLPLQIR